MGTYEKALQELYQVPLEKFVEERTRLAEELRSRGEKAAAAEFAKRRRPPTSVWAVNQLYWNARDAMDDMLAAAARVREGDLRASRDYHERIAKLRQRAAAMLKKAGYGVSDAALRRVATTLGAIAAGGGFDPDPPGALAADRDPPGFEALALSAKPRERELSDATPHERHAKSRGPHQSHDKHAGHGGGDLDAARDGAAAERERRKSVEAQQRAAQQERKRRDSERQRLQRELRAATAKVRTRERACSLLENQFRAAEKSVAEARTTVLDLEQTLMKLGDGG